MISSQQHRKLMKSYQQTENLSTSALRAGVDRKTARKYAIEGSPGPDEPRSARQWRTRPDAFAEIWPQVEEELGREPELEAKVLFEQVLEEHRSQFDRRQRRSFERRVRAWKLEHGPERELFFCQEHQPGERLQLDWFHASELEVRIGDEELEHLLVHAVLPYSNWEWARVCHSESFLSLKRGLQSALFELGGVPLICQTDQSSTATHCRGRGQAGRDYNVRYLGLLAHYGMKPAVIGIKQPHENGDVESAHRHLRQAIDQALRLKGSRTFCSVAEYEAFLFEVLRRRNEQRGQQGVFVDWRHVIGALQYKPGALIGWRHRAAMFPNAKWRALYDWLQGRYSPGRAEREYLGILALGLEQRLEALEAAIEELGDGVSLDALRQQFCPRANIVLLDLKVDLSPYDALLKPAGSFGEEVA